MNYAVILAGGSGRRLGGNLPKQLLPLGDKTVIQWSVDAFIQSGLVDGIIIVAGKSSLSEIREIFTEDKYPEVTAFVEGGLERSESSYNALLSRNFNDDDIIIFHDAARPFVDERIITDIINAAKQFFAAGTYIPSVDTISVIADNNVISIPERKNLFCTQTPQAFYYKIIKKAHEDVKCNNAFTVTDDVSLVINSGERVQAVKGSPSNIKITTDFDYDLARFIAGGGFNDR